MGPLDATDVTAWILLRAMQAPYYKLATELSRMRAPIPPRLDSAKAPLCRLWRALYLQLCACLMNSSKKTHWELSRTVLPANSEAKQGEC